MAPPSRVFLSYRHSDSAKDAVALQKCLEENGVRVFRDERDLPASANWQQSIAGEIDGSSAVLVLIGKRWLDANKAGRRRIDDPDDVVRREVEYGLRNKKRLVPLLLRRAKMPSSGNLPSSLRGLADIQAYSLPTPRGTEAIALARRLLEMSAQDAERSDKELEDVLQKAAADPRGFEILVYLPDHDDFRDFPIYGGWRIRVRELSGDRYELRVHLDESMGFSGILLTPRHGLMRLLGRVKQRMQGRWATLPSDDGRMLMKLNGLFADGESFEYGLPIQDKIGGGYLGRDNHGRTYLYQSRGGRMESQKLIQERAAKQL